MSIATSTQATAVHRPTVGALSLSGRTSDYVEMCRPRIAVMTMLAVSAGFVLASPIVIQWSVLAVALAGILQLVAASSMLNQVLEAGTDARMERTADRALAAGRISRLEATLVGLGLAISGVGILWLFTNPATALGGILTLLVYVLVYTPLKTRSILCTTVGAVPGAMPPVVGSRRSWSQRRLVTFCDPFCLAVSSFSGHRLDSPPGLRDGRFEDVAILFRRRSARGYHCRDLFRRVHSGQFVAVLHGNDRSIVLCHGDDFVMSVLHLDGSLCAESNDSART
jgi:hypothetical protein